jgi:hypothetical protein
VDQLVARNYNQYIRDYFILGVRGDYFISKIKKLGENSFCE